MSSAKIVVLSLGTRGASPAFTFSILDELQESRLYFKAILSSKSDLKHLFSPLFFRDSSITFLNNIPNTSRNALNLFQYINFFLRCFKLCRHSCQKTIVIHPFFHPWSFIFAIFTSCNFNHWIFLHDATPHDGDLRLFWRVINFITCNLFDKIILLSPYQKVIASKYCLNQTRSGLHVLHHPSFRHYKRIKETFSQNKFVSYPEYLNNIPPVDFLFFGRIERYKGLDLLLDSFCYYRSTIKYDASLLVVGRLAPNVNVELNLAGVTFINTFLDDQFVPYLFELSSVICFPYLSATQSGVLQLSFDMNKIVVCTPLDIFKYQASINKSSSFFSNNFTSFSFAAAMHQALSSKTSLDSTGFVNSGITQLLV